MGRATRQVVIDSSVVLPACLVGRLAFPRRWTFIAPRLMWSEVVSALHAAAWRGEISDVDAAGARRTLTQLSITIDDPVGLADDAWEVADELGLAKTYDAEFIALARLRSALFVTADARLHRTAKALGFVVDPVELMSR